MSAPTTLQVVLSLPLFVWAVVGIVMTFQSEAFESKPRAHSSFEWIRKCSPKWYRRLTYWVALPLLVVLLLCRHYGL